MVVSLSQLLFLFFLLLPPPPRSTLFPYTTLFRSALLELREDESLLVQSGKPVGIFRTHPGASGRSRPARSEEHTSELQSRGHLVCRLLLEKKKKKKTKHRRNQEDTTAAIAAEQRV